MSFFYKICAIQETDFFKCLVWKESERAIAKLAKVKSYKCLYNESLYYVPWYTVCLINFGQ